MERRLAVAAAQGEEDLALPGALLDLVAADVDEVEVVLGVDGDAMGQAELALAPAP